MPSTKGSLSDVEQRCCEVIAAREAELLADLAAHVSIPTGRDHRPGLDAYRALLEARLKKLGAVVEHLPADPRPDWLRQPGQPAFDQADPAPIVLARHEVGAAGGARLLCVGHLDTVHPPEGAFRELSPLPDGLHVTGPGAVDMKGGVLVLLTALETLHACGVRRNWTVLLNSDEETGSFQSESALRAAARGHDYGLVVEPALAGGALAIERMGSGQFSIEVFGRSAHVGRAFTEGVSAVMRLGEVLTLLATMARPEAGVIVNVGPLQGGTATNVVPEYAACWGNVRYADAEAGEALGRMIDALATSGAALPRVVVHRHWNRPAKPCTEATRALAEQARRAAEDLGQSLPFASTGGVCDGNILQDAGLPVIDTLGVRGGNLHRTDEFVEIASLVERSQLLAVLMCRLGA